MNVDLYNAMYLLYYPILLVVNCIFELPVNCMYSKIYNGGKHNGY